MLHLSPGLHDDDVSAWAQQNSMLLALPMAKPVARGSQLRFNSEFQVGTAAASCRCRKLLSFFLVPGFAHQGVQTLVPTLGIGAYPRTNYDGTELTGSFHILRVLEYPVCSEQGTAVATP